MFRHKNKLLIVIMLLIISFIGAFSTSYSEGEFDVNVRIGLNGYYRYTYNTPIRIEIKNNLKDINGKVQLLFNDGYIDKPLYTAYTKELNIAKGSTKVIDMSIVFESHISSAKVRVLDNRDKVVYEEKIDIYTGKSENAIGVGILSNDIDSLRYFTLVNISEQTDNGNSVTTYIAELEEFMLEKSSYLDALNVLVINNYDAEKLNSNHIEALKDWISKGGVLLVGTGPNYNRTLKGLDDIVDMNVQQTSYLDNFNQILSTSGEVFDTSLPLPIAVGEFNGGKNLLSYDGNVLINETQHGSGKIITTAFDLGLSPFVDWSGRLDFIKELLSGKVINGNLSVTDSKGLFNSYRFINNIQSIPNNKLPKLELAFIIIGIFILFVGPINYIVLKKLDKREKAWITIPAITFAFTLIMYFWGLGASFKEPLMNNISIISLDSATKNANITTISGIIGFTKGNIDVTTNENVTAKVGDRYRNEINYSNFQENDVILEYDIKKDTHIIFRERGIWDTQVVNLSETKILEGTLEQNITLNDSMISGSIENNTSINLEDAFILYGQSTQKLGNIEKGQNKDINISLNNSNTNSGTKIVDKDFYMLIENLYPWSAYNRNTNQATLNSNIKRDILEGYFYDSFARQNSNNIMLFAWSDEPIISDISINGKAPERIDRNLIVVPINFSYESGAQITVPYGVLSTGVEELSGLHAEIPNRRFYGNGYAIFTIKSDDRIEWDQIDIDITNGYPIQGYNPSIFNYQTKEWQKYNNTSITLDDSNKSQYYNEKLGVRIKIETNDHAPIDTPTFSIKGVAK